MKARLREAFWLLVSAFVAIGIWQTLISLTGLPKYVLPPPGAVWHELVAGLTADPSSRASIWYQLSDTLVATLWGFLLGGVGGVSLAAVMAEFRFVQKVLFPYVVGFQSLPKVAIAPLYVIWFGYEMEPKVAMSATLAFFPVLLNAMQGFVAIERDRMELFASLDASRWQRFVMIKLPSAAPLIFAGLNLGIVYALLGAIVAEFIGAQRGVGVLITQLQSVSDTAGVFAILVVLAVAGYVLITVMRLLQKHFVFWQASDTPPDAS